MWSRAVNEPERHARVHRMDERALPFDEEELPASPRPLDDQPLGRAGEEVGDHRVHGDPPARDRDSGLPGRHEHRVEPAPTRFEIELDRDRLLSDRAVGADRQHDRRVDLEVGPRRDAQPRGWLAEVVQLDPSLAGELGELGIVRDELVQAALDVEAGRDARLQQVSPGRREPAALSRNAHDGHCRLEAKRVVDGSDDRDALVLARRLAASREWRRPGQVRSG